MKKSFLFIFLIFYGFSVFSQNGQDDIWEDFLGHMESREKAFHPLDQFGLLEQKVFPQKRTIRFREYRLEIAGKVFTFSKPFEVKLEAEERGFSFFKFDHLVHEFNFSPTSMVFDGKRLFFIEESSLIKSEGYFQVFYLDLERFEKYLGKSEIPIFRFPFSFSGEIGELSLSPSQRLQVLGSEIPEAILLEYSQAQHLAMQTVSNLLSPELYLGSAPLVEEVVKEFNQSLSAVPESFLGGDSSKKMASDFSRYMGFLKEQGKTGERPSLEKFNQDFNAQMGVKAKLEAYGRRTSKLKKLVNRLHWIKLKMTYPNPLNLVGNIKEALYYSYFSKKRIKGLGTRSILKIMGNLGGTLATGAAIELSLRLGLETSLAEIFQGVLEMGRSIGEISLGKISDSSYLLGETVKKTGAGFNPSVLNEVFIANGNWKKTAIGVSAITGVLYTTLGVPHLIVNTVLLVKDLKKMVKEKGYQTLETLKNLKSLFIERQQKAQDRYEKLSAEKKMEVTPEQEAKAQEFLQNEKLMRKEKRSFLGRWLNSLGRSKLFSRFKKNDGGKTHQEIRSFRKALTHFAFSYASFTNSGKIYSQIWNAYFGFRSFVLEPVLFVKFAFYPRLFKVATSNPFHLVNRYNGGSISRVDHGLRLLKEGGDFLKNGKKLKEWENLFLELESKLLPMVMDEAKKEVAKYMSIEELQKTLLSGGLQSLGESKLKSLSLESKLFYSVYYKKLFSQVMEDIVEGELFKGGEGSLSFQKRQSLERLKQVLKRADFLKLTSIQKDLALKETLDVVGEGSLFQKAKEHLSRRLYQKLSPHLNTQVNRITTVNRKINEPEALARGVRSMIASNVVDKPLELMTLFIATAGISSGIMRPLYPEMFSDDSWFYLSRYLFTNGFIYGTLTGVLAHVWMKVQQDEMNEGNFGVIPDEAEAKKGFLPWLWKQGFKNPKNSFWKNQKHYWKIITANLKAALVSTVIVNMITLGRVELDGLFAGYFLAYTVMSNGFLWKLEQAFDLATGWFYAHIPKDIRHVPMVRNKVEGRISRAKMTYNFFYKNLENFSGFFLSNLGNVSTEKLGSRSMVRMLLGGEILTEKVANATTALSEKFPKAEKIIKFCGKLFTNNTPYAPK